MSSKISRLFLFLFVFIVSLYAVSAVSEDFYAYFQQNEVSACSCGIFSTQLVVKNTGTITSSYQIFSGGSAAKWATLAEDSFVLEPGETKTIVVYVNLPCGIEGRYALDLNVTTLFGNSRVVEQSIDAGVCQNFELIAKESFKEGCPCTPTPYEFVISNTGSYAETFSLSLSKFNEYASFSESILTLLPGEKKEIFVYLNLPCMIYGLNDIEFVAMAKKSGFKAISPLQLKINPCYDFEINVSNVALCQGEKKQSSLLINNLANISNQFQISADSKLIEIENKSVFIFKRQSAAVPFVVNAENADAGTRNVTFDVVASRGELREGKTISVDVVRCYSVGLSAEKLKDDLIAGKQKRYKLSISNDGTKPSTYRLALEGADWFRLTSYELFVPPMSGREVELIANVPLNATSEKRWAKVSASILNNTRYSAELNFEFNIHSMEEAYRLYVVPVDLKVKYGEDFAKVKVKNVGFEKGEYEIELEGPSWISVLDSDKIFSLAVGEEKEIELKTNADEDVIEDDYGIVFYAKIRGSDLAYMEEFNVKLRSAPWYAKAFFALKGFLLDYWLYLAIAIAAIVVLLLLIFVIKKVVRMIKERPKKVEEVKAIEVAEEPLKLSVKRGFVKRIKILNVLGVLLLLAIVLGAVGYFGYSFLKEREKAIEPEKEVEEFRPIVEVNRTAGLEGFENVVFIRGSGPIVVPVIIKNRAPIKVAYDINVNSSWISSDVNRIELDIEETKTINLTISPTPDIKDGDYKIVLDLRIAEKDLSYKESIELRIERQRSLIKDYLPYIIAGLLILAMLIILLRLTRRSGFEAMPERAEIKFIKEKKERKWVKKIAVWLMILIVFGGLSYFTYINWPEVEESRLAIDFSTLENQSGTISVDRGEKIIIPITFSNTFDSRVMYSIEFDEEWIDATERRIGLNPGESEEINISASPNENVSDGAYEIKIVGEIKEREISAEKTIILLVKTKGFALLKKYPYFLAAGIVIAFALLLFFEYRALRRKRAEIIESIRKEVEIKKGKLKKRRIKLKK